MAGVLLESAGPWSTMGHLLHMPSHTFVRVGRYNDAVLANIRPAPRSTAPPPRPAPPARPAPSVRP